MKKYLIVCVVFLQMIVAVQIEARGRIINKTGSVILIYWNGYSSQYDCISNNGVMKIPDSALNIIIKEEKDTPGAMDVAAVTGYFLKNPKAIDYVVTFDKENSSTHQFVVKESTQPAKSFVVKSKK